mmetsp:Transcript_12243/g.29850  ORF Transcript_12243/g.29850 Transcript_12243/m.29850 type:complete len:264 (-) Transcript_12243:1053-1844(-)
MGMSIASGPDPKLATPGSPQMISCRNRYRTLHTATTLPKALTAAMLACPSAPQLTQTAWVAPTLVYTAQAAACWLLLQLTCCLLQHQKAGWDRHGQTTQASKRGSSGVRRLRPWTVPRCGETCPGPSVPPSQELGAQRCLHQLTGQQRASPPAAPRPRPHSGTAAASQSAAAVAAGCSSIRSSAPRVRRGGRMQGLRRRATRTGPRSSPRCPQTPTAPPRPYPCPRPLPARRRACAPAGTLGTARPGAPAAPAWARAAPPQAA